MLVRALRSSRQPHVRPVPENHIRKAPAANPETFHVDELDARWLHGGRFVGKRRGSLEPGSPEGLGSRRGARARVAPLRHRGQIGSGGTGTWSGGFGRRSSSTVQIDQTIVPSTAFSKWMASIARACVSSVAAITNA